MHARVVKWYNATPHAIKILSPDEEGVIQGVLNRMPMKFRVVKEISPEIDNQARLVSNHPHRPQAKEVEGVLLVEHQPWNGLNLDLMKIPGKTWPHQTDFEPADVVYLIVSLPVAEYINNSRLQMPPPIYRTTPTVLICPNTSPEGCVRDESGGIIGVVSMKAFGDFCFRK